ncbi:LysR substrate-binding domain-containing protein [Biostraticola tofi]|uniref:LysR substrate-binding domain-containing protein n=1 Tax=Biostraticola tofi TaxID=466109 RepID=UPI0038B3E67A
MPARRRYPCAPERWAHRHYRPRRSRTASESFVIPEQVLGLREVARRGRFDPHIISSPGSLVAVLTQVALGVGVAVIPSVLINTVQLPNVVFREIAGPAIISEVAALFRRHERLPTVRNLIDQLLETNANAPFQPQ